MELEILMLLCNYGAVFRIIIYIAIFRKILVRIGYMVLFLRKKISIIIPTPCNHNSYESYLTSKIEFK